MGLIDVEESERAGRRVEAPPAKSMSELADAWIERRKKTHRSATIRVSLAPGAEVQKLGNESVDGAEASG